MGRPVVDPIKFKYVRHEEGVLPSVNPRYAGIGNRGDFEAGQGHCLLCLGFE